MHISLCWSLYDSAIIALVCVQCQFKLFTFSKTKTEHDKFSHLFFGFKVKTMFLLDISSTNSWQHQLYVCNSSILLFILTHILIKQPVINTFFMMTQLNYHKYRKHADYCQFFTEYQNPISNKKRVERVDMLHIGSKLTVKLMFQF